MKSEKSISLEHEITTYNTKASHYRENELVSRKYCDYIYEYSLNHENFLELGIGFGDTMEFISSNFSNIVVLDGEKEFVDNYQKIYPDITFIHTYFEDYKTTKKFDNIGMGFVLDLVKNPLELLKKYANLLTKEGRIFLSIQCASSLHRKIAYNAGILDDVKKMTELDKKFNHQFFYTYDEFVSLFEEAGLRIVTKHGLFLKSFTTAQIQSLELEDNVFNALAESARDLPEISSACLFVLEK